jgi:hypothetical protein
MQTFPLRPKSSSPLQGIAIATVFAFIIYFTLRLAPFGSASHNSITSNSDHLADMIPLFVRISNIEETTSAGAEHPQLNLKVTITNTSPDKPVSFLRWATPFDLKAVTMGIFKFRNLKTGEFAPCLDMKISRKMPESEVFDDEDVIIIEAGKDSEQELVVVAPKVVLDSGEKYEVFAKGRWMYVSVGKTEKLGSSEGKSISGEFESDSVQFELKK